MTKGSGFKRSQRLHVSLKLWSIPITSAANASVAELVFTRWDCRYSRQHSLNIRILWTHYALFNEHQF